MGNSILISGSTDFVGASLARRLSGEGCEVHIPLRHTSNLWRIADLTGKVTEHVWDLTDAATVESCIAAIRPDAVCHLTTYGGYLSAGCMGDCRGQSGGDDNLLTACEKVGFRLFINTGSSSEYGEKWHAMIEGDLPEPAVWLRRNAQHYRRTA